MTECFICMIILSKNLIGKLENIAENRYGEDGGVVGNDKL